MFVKQLKLWVNYSEECTISINVPKWDLISQLNSYYVWLTNHLAPLSIVLVVRT